MKEPDRHPGLANTSDRPRVLFVTDVPYWNLNRGSSRRIDSMIRHLLDRFEVSLCFVGEMPVASWVRAEDHFRVPLLGPGRPSAIARQLARFLKRNIHADPCGPSPSPAVFRPPSKTLGGFRSEVIGEYVANLVEKTGIDVVIIEYITLAYLAEFVKRSRSAARIIIDTHDVMHLRSREFQRLGLAAWLDIDAAGERAAMVACDAIIAISDVDQQLLRNLVPEKPVLLAHYAISVPDQTIALPPETGTVTVGFVGSRGDANRAGLLEFLMACWPRVVDALGQSVLLRIAGPFEALDFPDVLTGAIRFGGPVDDLASFYRSIDIAINPAVVHSGFKVKSLEALAWGVPLVTTTAGIAGLSVALGRGAWASDKWPEFAGVIINLAGDRRLRQRSAVAALDVVKRHYAPEVAYAELVTWIASVS
jgi:glycosyltransferase involved in cell wall biosynthesis